METRPISASGAFFCVYQSGKSLVGVRSPRSPRRQPCAQCRQSGRHYDGQHPAQPGPWHRPRPHHGVDVWPGCVYRCVPAIVYDSGPAVLSDRRWSAQFCVHSGVQRVFAYQPRRGSLEDLQRRDDRDVVVCYGFHRGRVDLCPAACQRRRARQNRRNPYVDRSHEPNLAPSPIRIFYRRDPVRNLIRPPTLCRCSAR